MLADRFTFFAQIANFLILVWLLRRFLFRPILKAANEREARLDAVRKEAEAARTSAEAEKREWEARRAEIESGKRELLRRAEAEAQAHKEELLARIRTEAEAERSKWDKSLEDGRKARSAAWAQRIRKEAFALADKTLREVSDTRLEAACVQVFLRKLEAMSPRERSRFAPRSAGPGPSGPGSERAIDIRTSLDLGQEAGAALAAGLRRILGTDAPVRIATDPALGLGLEMAVEGRTLAWTIPQALSDLESRAEAAMESRHGSA